MWTEAELEAAAPLGHPYSRHSFRCCRSSRLREPELAAITMPKSAAHERTRLPTNINPRLLSTIALKRHAGHLSRCNLCVFLVLFSAAMVKEALTRMHADAGRRQKNEPAPEWS